MNIFLNKQTCIFFFLILLFAAQECHTGRLMSKLKMRNQFSEYFGRKHRNSISNLISLKNSPKVYMVHNDESDESEYFYISANSDPRFYYSDNEEKLSSDNVRQYSLGGWVRWLSFIPDTYEDNGLPASVFRLMAREPAEDSNDYYDNMGYILASSDSYQICSHDLHEDSTNECVAFNYSGSPRENAWHFLMFIYDYDTKTVYIKIKINDQWIVKKSERDHKEFNGYVGLFLGGDKTRTHVTSFNGHLYGWNMYYGVNFLNDYLEGDGEDYLQHHFSDLEEFPYVDKILYATSNKIAQSMEDYSSFTFMETFMEAKDYGVGFWLKVMNPEDGTYEEDEKYQIITLAFENDEEKNTIGKKIAQIYLKNNDLFSDVYYESNNNADSSAQKIVNQFKEEWIFIQVKFSSTDKKITTTVYDGTNKNSFDWDVSSIFVPKNIYLTFGKNDILNRSGAEFKFKKALVFAGNHEIYEEATDSTIKNSDQLITLNQRTEKKFLR